MKIFDIEDIAIQGAGNEWNHTNINQINRFELRSGDRINGTDTERSEMGSSVIWLAENEIDITYKFMIEEGAPNTASWLVLGQFFSAPGTGGGAWSPPFAAGLKGENLCFMVRSSVDPRITSNPTGEHIFMDTAPIQRGQWYDMNIRIVFDPYGNGSVVITRDGELLADYAGPVGYADSNGYYWKEGVYRSPSPETIAVNYADTEVSYSAPDGSRESSVIAYTVGNDVIWGTAANDIINGGDGGDKLYGHAGDDTINGGNGVDVLAGMTGADTLDGGAGNDIAYYRLSEKGVTVSLDNGRGFGGDAEGDTLVNIESINGSKFEDTLIGDRNINALDGGSGDDRLDGGGAGDILLGRGGIDTALYQYSQAGVTVDLATGIGKGGFAEGDRLSDIENIDGSNYADVLIGNILTNVLRGGSGDDELHGGMGDDTLIGGFGNDTISGDIGIDVLVLSGNKNEYSFETLSDGRIRVADKFIDRDGIDVLDGIDIINFHDGYAQIGDRSLIELERVSGTPWDDKLKGASAAEKLTGNKGDDRLFGYDDNDVLVGGRGADRLNGGAGADMFVFKKASDSTTNTFDTIYNFTVADGDRIDLSMFDADFNAANTQDFTFIGNQAFSGEAGELRYDMHNNKTFIEADRNGDGKTDFVVKLNVGMDISADCFVF